MATSNGPDCSRGANCCCDACLHEKISCLGECCKCTPNLICLTFTPDTPDVDCIEVAVLLGTEDNDGGVYTGNLRNVVGKGIDAAVTVSVGVLSGSICVVNVLIPDLGVDQDFEIDGVYVTCTDFTLTIAVSNGYCPGTLSISRYDLTKVPFESRSVTIGESAFVCGPCSTVCDLLCVEYYIDDPLSAVDILVRREFSWNALNSRWENSTDYIVPVDATSGTCSLDIQITEVGAVDPPVISVCGASPDGETLGLLVDTLSDAGKTVKLSCNPCSCWDYVCGTCRCACSTLCVMLQSNYAEPTFLELGWDAVLHRWGDDYYAVYLTRDVDTGECLLEVPGFDPIPLDSCGIEVSFSLDDDNGNRAIGSCKRCKCFAKNAECCGSTIYELPMFLVATVENQSLCSCWTASTVYLMYNPIDTSWSGSGLGSCPYTKIHITVSCNGGALSLTALQVCCEFPIIGWQCSSDLVSSVTILTNSCPPLLMEITDVVIDAECCENEGMAGGTIKITITE